MEQLVCDDAMGEGTPVKAIRTDHFVAGIEPLIEPFGYFQQR